MADRPALEAVLLDAGGTLGRLDFEWMAEALRELGHAVDAETLRASEIEGRRRYDASAHVRRAAVAEGQPLGTAGDIHAYFGGALEAAGVPVASVPEIVARFLLRERTHGLWSRPMEGAREALDALTAMGLRRAVVSNSDGRAAQHVAAWGLGDRVEFVVDSAVVGIEKPDPGIFRVALERLAVAAERVLFVGDIRSVDEVGAKLAGLSFVLIDPTCRYVAPGGDSIRSIGELPAWIERRFTVHRAGAAGAHAGGRAGRREGGSST